ncbi:hypothetical protein MNB_SUP05-SYMBIONT-4-627 [hydrothermal vent metagenome]|uniref:Uncharacterized protein n=1 Tax=hydrothermal vent metagenome TaxID=652676 RepID=A0A1W1E2Z5_9ZZZZ
MNPFVVGGLKKKCRSWLSAKVILYGRQVIVKCHGVAL